MSGLTNKKGIAGAMSNSTNKTKQVNAPVIEETTNEFEFKGTMSLSTFKSALGVDKVSVVKNPHTGKLFIAAVGHEGSLGSISDKAFEALSSGDSDNVVVSEMHSADGFQGYTVHTQSSDNTVLTF